MDRRRLREFRVRARQHFLEVHDEGELVTAEGLLTDCEREGESVFSYIQRRSSKQEQLLDLTRALNAERDLDRLLEKIVDAAIELCAAERGVLILAGDGHFQPEVARRFGGEDLHGLDRQFSRTIARKVIQEECLIQLEDALADAELSQHPSVRQMKLRSILAVPLRGRERVLGALYIDNRFALGVFGACNEEVLQILADQASVAIENARLRQEVLSLNETLQLKLEAMSGIVENQRQQLQGRTSGYHDILGCSPGMREVFSQIERIAQVDIPILIQGESGTGKELAARAIHASSPRVAGPFISENCGAIAESLAESELFGYVAGAFTGATSAKKGLFELAQGGTLFLDEVADLSDQLQKKLLRVVQEGEVRPVGGKEPISLDVRIISAANQPLAQLVASGKFREDLFFRLKGFMICLPPLRERREDIPLLVEHFIPGRRVEPHVIDALLAHDWPGNIRELRNECQAMAAMTAGEISPADLSATFRGDAVVLAADSDPQSLERAVEAVERKAIVRALSQCRNKTEAAERLQISRYTLNRKLGKYELDF